MDNEVSFNVINSNKQIEQPTSVKDVITTMADHKFEDVHLNSIHGRSVVLRNFNNNNIMDHQLDHTLRPLRTFLNKPLRKALDSMGERIIYNELLESLV